MRKFVINVNGNSYEVEVEEIGGAPSVAPVAAATPTAVPTTAPATAPTPTPAPTPVVAAPPAGATNITAPMPGSIVSVKVSVGQAVKKGDVLCVLEAMKMENEIMAPSDGKVVSVSTTQGSTVNTGDVLVSLG